MPLIIPISQLPQGTVATNDALTAISVATLSENASVRTLGRNAVNDGGASTFYFDAASSATVDGNNVLATPTTGRWISALPSFSGLGPITADYTGRAENLVIASGFVPVTYTLPPLANMIGKDVTTITATTGTFTVRCANATDLIMHGGLPVASVVTTLTGGQAFNFIGYGGRWWLKNLR